MKSEIRTTIDLLGFATVPEFLTHTEVENLRVALGETTGPGARGIFRIPSVFQLAYSERLLDLVRPHVPGAPRPVRAIYFDKSPSTNWLVSWHQDSTLAVRFRKNVAEFGPWSTKDGVPHVQAPLKFLEQMLTVRLHFDDCDTDNGALRVLMGSHRFGFVRAHDVPAISRSCPDSLCCVKAGEALLMRPLLVHSSGRSKSARRRRVLHLEYSGCDLPDGLEWHEFSQAENIQLETADLRELEPIRGKRIVLDARHDRSVA